MGDLEREIQRRADEEASTERQQRDEAKEREAKMHELVTEFHQAVTREGVKPHRVSVYSYTGKPTVFRKNRVVTTLEREFMAWTWVEGRSSDPEMSTPETWCVTAEGEAYHWFGTRSDQVGSRDIFRTWSAAELVNHLASGLVALRQSERDATS